MVDAGKNSIRLPYAFLLMLLIVSTQGDSWVAAQDYATESFRGSVLSILSCPTYATTLIIDVIEVTRTKTGLTPSRQTVGYASKQKPSFTQGDIVDVLAHFSAFAGCTEYSGVHLDCFHCLLVDLDRGEHIVKTQTTITRTLTTTVKLGLDAQLYDALPYVASLFMVALAIIYSITRLHHPAKKIDKRDDPGAHKSMGKVISQGIHAVRRDP